MGKHESTENEISFHVPNRVLDDTLLDFDLTLVIEKLKQEEKWKKGLRDAITLVKNAGMKILLIALHKQMELNCHETGNLLSVQVMEGIINFQTDNQSVILKKESLLMFHENTKHTFIAIEDSVILLTISIVTEKIDVN
jgi:quercetin dioxygenase-like cupin family protein